MDRPTSSLHFLQLLLVLVLVTIYVPDCIDGFSVTTSTRVTPYRWSKPSYATIPQTSEQISTSSTATTTSRNDTTSSIPMGWECTEDVECTEVPLCTPQECRTSLDVRYHQNWYDVSGWRSKHPAGSHWIDYYDGRDATEVLDGFHTTKGQAMITRLPKSKPAVTELLKQTVPDDSTTQLNFRALRKDLEQEGYWERNLVHEYTQLGIWATLVMSAAVLSHIPLSVMSAPVHAVAQIGSSFLLALSMTAAGWLGHDYIHGIDTFAYKLRNFAAVAAGLAPIWWSDKHNKVKTRRMGCVLSLCWYAFLLSDLIITFFRHWFSKNL